MRNLLKHFKYLDIQDKMFLTALLTIISITMALGITHG